MAIDNEPLRTKFRRLEDSGEVTAAAVASRCGWETKEKSGRMKPDSSRVNRALGVTSDNGVTRSEVSDEQAELLADALHMDPHEIGL